MQTADSQTTTKTLNPKCARGVFISKYNAARNLHCYFQGREDRAYIKKNFIGVKMEREWSKSVELVWEKSIVLRGRGRGVGSLSNFYRRDTQRGTVCVECGTLDQHNTTPARKKEAGWKEEGNEKRKMCIGYTRILTAERRERGWLSMRGVVAPPPPSNDQAETTFGVADPRAAHNVHKRTRQIHPSVRIHTRAHGYAISSLLETPSPLGEVPAKPPLAPEK